MVTFSRPRAWAALGIVLVLAAPARAQQDSPLASVPAKAHVVVQISGLDKAKGKLGKMLANALPDLAPKLTADFDAQLKAALDDRDLKGVDKDKPVFLVYPEFPISEEALKGFAVIIPVTKYADFKNNALTPDERKTIKKDDGFETVTVKDETLYLCEYKNNAVVAYTAGALKMFADKPAGLDTKMAPDVAKAFLTLDVGVFLNLAAINEKYGFQIKLGKTLIEGFIAQAAQGGNTPGFDKKNIEMVKGVLNGVFQVLEDGTGVVLGVEFRPEGANLHGRAQFGRQSTTNKFLRQLKPGSMADVGTLPTGQLIYSAMQLDPALVRAINDYVFGVMGAGGEDEKANKAIEEALEELADAGLIGQIASTSYPTQTLQVMKFKDPAKAAAAQMKLFKAIPEGGTFSSASIKGKPEIKADAEQLRGFTLSSVAVKFDMDKMTKDLPDEAKDVVKGMMKKMIGDEVRTWFGTDGKVYLAAQAADWKSAKRLIEEYLDGKKAVSGDEAFAVVRKQLPAEATMLNLIDAGRFMVFGMEYMQSMMQMFPGGVVPGAPQIPVLKPPQGKPAYLGLALVLKSESASFDLFVPATVVQQIRTMVAGLVDN
jgi:hypothetical protein